MKKRFLCILLALCMVLMLVPQAAFAATTVPVESIAVIVEEPVIGGTPATPVYTATPAGSVQLIDCDWLKISEMDYTGTNKDIWTEMSANDVFEEGYHYSVETSFIPNENYGLVEEMTATVNGNSHIETYSPVYFTDKGFAYVCGVFEPLNHVSSEEELRAAVSAGITRILLTDDLTINEQYLLIGSGQTLTIPKGVTLTIQNTALGIQQDAVLVIQQGATLTIVEGQFANLGGKIYVDEKVNEMLQGLSGMYYLLNVENASASVEPAENLSEYEGKTYVSAGSTITLTPDHPPAGYWFVGWDVSSDSTVTVGADHKFTMPNAAVTVAPRWQVIPYEPISPKPIVENDGNATTSADLSNTTSTSGGTTTATIDQFTADKIVDNAVANKSEEVVINATAKTEAAAASTTAVQVGIPTNTLGAIAEKTEADVTVKTDIAEIKLDNTAAGAVAQQAAGDTVQLMIEKVDEKKNKVEFQLKVICSDGNVIRDFRGGNVAVTVRISGAEADIHSGADAATAETVLRILKSC